jgi:hypothetical protein
MRLKKQSNKVNFIGELIFGLFEQLSHRHNVFAVMFISCSYRLSSA